VWYPSEKCDLKQIDEETNLMTSDDLAGVKEQRKHEKHVCLYFRLEQPTMFKVLLKLNMTEITKTKSEGRVAAGKKLVEWNRKKQTERT